MATTQEPGATGIRVGANVKTLREAAGLTFRALSERLAGLGRQMLPSGLHRLEQGRRRIDADELVALALALGVTPNRLLLPPDADGATVELTAGVETRALYAWMWANGSAPLPPPGQHPLDHRPDPAEVARFSRVNRPNNPHEPVYLHEYEESKEALTDVLKAVSEALRAGVPMRVIKGAVDTVRAGHPSSSRPNTDWMFTGEE